MLLSMFYYSYNERVVYLMEALEIVMISHAAMLSVCDVLK